MTEQKNSPVLRFPGFDSNWSKKRLKKIADINPKSKQNRPEQFNYIDLESVKQGRIINISKVSKDNAPSRAQRIAQKQDIFFQTVRPYQQNNFIYNFDVDDVVVSTGYAQFRTINHKYYIFTLLHTYRFLVNVLLNCTGSNYPAINSTDLSNIEVYITENKLEQEKIGNFFSKLDQQIELEEKKLKLLEQQKRGYMQKIFSQELRFKDDNGNDYPDWEETTLKNITNYISSKKSSNQYNESNNSEGYPVYDAIQEIGKDLQYDMKEPYISILKDGAGVGRLNLRAGKSSVIGTMGYIQANNVDIQFLYYRMKLLNFRKFIIGSTIPHLYYKDYSKEKILIPTSNDEQKKIGRFILNIDKLIDNKTLKLDYLKQRKQGLLQKMFI